MSEFDNDLYGDLDLEDLDATQLDEELVDPDQEKQDDNKDSSAHNDAPVKSEPAPAPSNDNHASSSNREQGGNDGFFENRMRPSDMPDEGLVLGSVASLAASASRARVARHSRPHGCIRAPKPQRCSSTVMRSTLSWRRRASASMGWLCRDSYSCRLPGRLQTATTQLDRTDIALALSLHPSRKTRKHNYTDTIPMSSFIVNLRSIRTITARLPFTVHALLQQDVHRWTQLGDNRWLV